MCLFIELKEVAISSNTDCCLLHQIQQGAFRPKPAGNHYHGKPYQLALTIPFSTITVDVPVTPRPINLEIEFFQIFENWQCI